MSCDRCGVDVGTDGVVTVMLAKNQEGAIEALPVRECRECALKQAREETSDE